MLLAGTRKSFWRIPGLKLVPVLVSNSEWWRIQLRCHAEGFALAWMDRPVLVQNPAVCDLHSMIVDSFLYLVKVVFHRVNRPRYALLVIRFTGAFSF